MTAESWFSPTSCKRRALWWDLHSLARTWRQGKRQAGRAVLIKPPKESARCSTWWISEQAELEGTLKDNWVWLLALHSTILHSTMHGSYVNGCYHHLQCCTGTSASARNNPLLSRVKINYATPERTCTHMGNQGMKVNKIKLMIKIIK